MTSAVIPDTRFLLAGNARAKVEVVSDFGSLLQLQPAWDELMERAELDHPFLSHEWVRTWWECFGAGKELHIVLVRDGGELVGIAPLMRSDERRYGLRVRRLGSLYNPHTPRSGFIVARGAPGVVAAIWQHLFAARRDWDVLELCQHAGGSTTLEELPELAKADGFLTGLWQARGSPYLSISGTWDDYWRGLNAKHRSNLRNRIKRLGQLGEIGLEHVATAECLAGGLEDGFRLEAAAWKDRAGTAIASHPELRHFYRRLAESMAQRGRLDLQFLTVGGRRISFAYSLRYRNRLYLLKPGYDPDYAPYSPGNLLLWLVLREAFEQGVAEHDFLGVDDAWKREWTQEVRPHFWFHAFARTLRGAVLHALKFRLAPMVRRRLP
jgi:CelD/BcsL family acetyltransferase involved in cellulose biosynthesis